MFENIHEVNVFQAIMRFFSSIGQQRRISGFVWHWKKETETGKPEIVTGKMETRKEMKWKMENRQSTRKIKHSVTMIYGFPFTVPLFGFPFPFPFSEIPFSPGHDVWIPFSISLISVSLFPTPDFVDSQVYNNYTWIFKKQSDVDIEDIGRSPLLVELARLKGACTYTRFPWPRPIADLYMDRIWTNRAGLSTGRAITDLASTNWNLSGPDRTAQGPDPAKASPSTVWATWSWPSTGRSFHELAGHAKDRAQHVQKQAAVGSSNACLWRTETGK